MSGRPTPPSWLRWTFLFVAVGLGAWAMARDWTDLAMALRSVSPLPVAASTTFAGGALFFSATAWRWLLVDHTLRIRLGTAAAIFCLGQIGKYLPGSVWPLLAQMELSKVHGVPRQRSAQATIVAIAMAVVVGLIIGIAALPLAMPEIPLVAIGVLIPVVLIAFSPRLVAHAIALLLRGAGQPSVRVDLSARHLGLAWAGTLASWLGLSLHAAALGLALGAQVPDIPFVVATFALAWVAGFLIVFAPAGIGVREAILTVGLTGIMSSSEALALALMSRGVTTAVDIVASAVAATALRPHRSAERRALD